MVWRRVKGLGLGRKRAGRRGPELRRSSYSEYDNGVVVYEKYCSKFKVRILRQARVTPEQLLAPFAAASQEATGERASGDRGQLDRVIRIQVHTLIISFSVFHLVLLSRTPHSICSPAMLFIVACRESKGRVSSAFRRQVLATHSR